MTIRNVEIVIKGRVQGVGFRYHARQAAIELNLKGFVKNLPDKSVYILASGTHENIDRLINWCQLGPRLAVVESVIVTDVSKNEHDEFLIR